MLDIPKILKAALVFDGVAPEQRTRQGAFSSFLHLANREKFDLLRHLQALPVPSLAGEEEGESEAVGQMQKRIPFCASAAKWEALTLSLAERRVEVL